MLLLCRLPLDDLLLSFKLPLKLFKLPVLLLALFGQIVAASLVYCILSGLVRAYVVQRFHEAALVNMLGLL